MAATVKLNPSALKELRKVNPCLMSYNIEMTEVTGGTFWKEYTPAQIAGTEEFPPIKDLREMAGLMQVYPPIDLSGEKVRRLALKSVLSAKAAEGRIIVVDSIAMDAIKTKAFRGFLDAVQCDGKAVVVTPEVNETVVKSARNIPGVLTTTAKLLNVYDILNAKYLVIDQAALATIEEVYA